MEVLAPHDEGANSYSYVECARTNNVAKLDDLYSQLAKTIVVGLVDALDARSDLDRLHDQLFENRLNFFVGYIFK